MTFTVGSLFSGIGGLDLGLERAGMRIIWQAEIEPYCCRVLARHWPKVPNLGNVREVEWCHVKRPDLVCGGFPCQPASLAGTQKGPKDDRWLWPEFERCLRHLRPRYALVENVTGLLGLGFSEIVAGLATLGYGFEWDRIPAAAFGAPHLRQRVFIVAHLACPGLEGGNGEEAPGPPGRYALGRQAPGVGGHWAIEPNVGRVVYGIPARVDRIKALGNAVVPQVAEWIGAQILEADKERSTHARYLR